MTTQPMKPTKTDQIPEEELVRENDEIIGKAFRWSLVILGIFVLAVAGTVWYIKRDVPDVYEVKQKGVGEEVALPPAGDAHRQYVDFTDVTSQAGLHWVHFNGASGDKMLPETMGGGCAFFDYDNDGDQDLLLVNGTTWSWDTPVEPLPTHALYQNDGMGNFADVTQGSGLDVSMYGMGAACGDYDNDGHVDVLMTAVGTNRLFHNEGDGTFKDVTQHAGVGGADDQWSSSAGFIDFENDGDLDLYVCNYIHWSRDIDIQVNFTLNGKDRAYGPPTNFEGADPYIYVNNGDGTFSDVTSKSAAAFKNEATGVSTAKSLGIALVDVDNDGLLDLFIANDTTGNYLLHNKGDGRFEDKGREFSIAHDAMGASTGAMGPDCVRFRNDEEVGVGVGNFSSEATGFYVLSQFSGTFSDESAPIGIASASRQALSFGLFFFDYDLDGWPDMLQANGHLEEEINEIQPSQHYKQSAQLFWNAGPDAKQTFAIVSDSEIGDLAKKIVGRGATYADIDNDGDQDVLLTQIAGPPLLVRNDQNLNRHWLRVKLTGNGTTTNRDAIGAEVIVTAKIDQSGKPAKEVTQRRMVMPTKSYLSQCELPITFGLGDATDVESLLVKWPDGSEQIVDVDSIDTTLHVQQDT